MIEIEASKNKPRLNSARVNLRNESNAVFGGRKELNEPVASKKVYKNFNQHTIFGSNVDKEIKEH